MPTISYEMQKRILNEDLKLGIDFVRVKRVTLTFEHGVITAQIEQVPFTILVDGKGIPKAEHQPV